MARTKKSREERRFLREMDAHIAEIEKAARLEELYIKDAAKLLEDAPLETPFVIDQCMPDQGICFLAGKPGSMKSWLAYDAALAVARGRPWLGFNVPEAGKVVIFNFDNPSHELGRRMRRLGLTPEDKVYFHSPASELPPEGLPAMLQLPGCIDAILMLLQRIRPHLVIVDSYRQAHTGEEHSSQDMGRIMSCLRAMSACGCTVLVLHHLRKQGQMKDDEDDEPLRGSTEIEASADAIMILKNGKLTLTKTRGWNPDVTEVDYLVEDPTEETTVVKMRGEMAVLIAAIETGVKTKTELKQILGINQKAVRDLVDKAIDQGIVREYRPSGSKTRVVDFTEEYAAENYVPDDEDEGDEDEGGTEEIE